MVARSSLRGQTAVIPRIARPRESRLRELAIEVKCALCNRVGECLTCSIGIVPNVFLGKVDSELQKPDRLVVLTKDDLAEDLLRLTVHEIYGIGERMEQRLHSAGIFTVAQLWRSFGLASSPLFRIAVLTFRNGVAWRRKFG
jgi:hypothetical protein